jgi:dTDP-D-glucose 4,6-dehydratase
LPWRPVTTLTEGLRLTAEWYKAHASGANARRLSEQQIHEFLRRSAA